MLDCLADLEDPGEVSHETEAAIQEGMEDIRAGRTVTLEEYLAGRSTS